MWVLGLYILLAIMNMGFSTQTSIGQWWEPGCLLSDDICTGSDYLVGFWVVAFFIFLSFLIIQSLFKTPCLAAEMS